MSEFPSDWRVLPLGEVAEVVGGGTPSRDVPAFWGNDHYWITPSEVVAKDGQTADRSKEQISDLGLQSSGAKLHPPGTILMTSRASIGFAAITQKEICTNQGFQSLRCGNELDNWFALHQIRHRRAELHQLAAGSTFLDVSGSNVRSFPFIVPPLPEQKKIAEILSGIDRSIKAKELSIHKADSILRARKDDLMSGVEDWQEFELGELLAFRNGLNTEKENFGQGVPFVSYKNVYSGGIVTAKFLSQSVSLSTDEVERFSLRSGDILFTRTSETPDEIGFSCVFDDKHGSAVFNGFCIRGRPHEEGKLTPDFASFYLKSESILSQMRFLCKYTTRAGISAESLSRVKVRIPDPSTQQQLANSLIAVNEFRTTQEESVRNLKNIKRAVSSDLLSGRKRVSI